MNSNSSPLVSVIMPVYNHKDYVEQALHSILSQTYSNIEIIIIDDGSTDTSCSVIDTVLKNHTDRNVQFIKQKNTGAHAAINYGLSLAKGEWLTILNSDDYYHPERIQNLIQQTICAKAELAFTYVVAVDNKNIPLPPEHWWWKWYERTRCHLMITSTPTVGFQLLEDNIAVSTGNLFFTQSLFKEVGPFKNLKLAHDLDFLLRALPLTEPLMVRDNHYYYRLHNTNSQHSLAHIAQWEMNEIYREYLTRVYHILPRNTQAPCHWYWPTEFAKWRTKLRMDQGLNGYISRPPSVINKDKLLPSREIKSYKNPITLISHEMSLSGAPKLISDLAICLKEEGYSPYVISITDGPMKKVLEKHNIPVKVIVNNSRLLGIFKLFYTLLFGIKGQVIGNSIMSWQLILPLTLLRPWKKPIWYIHETFTLQGALRGIRGRLASGLIWISKKTVLPRLWFGSNSTRKAWEYTHLSQGKVMYWSGIPKQDIKSVSEIMPLKRLLSVGTASARKGTHTLIDAFLLCLTQNRIPSDAVLTIVGIPCSTSPHFADLADTILKVITSKHKDSIRLIGSVDPSQLDYYYQQTDVFIQSSISECMPIALLTAMSRGLPIVTTNVDGCGEAIEDKQTGYLCLPHNVSSLAEAIALAINHPEESIPMGLRAQSAFNERFSLEATKKHILNELQR